DNGVAPKPVLNPHDTDYIYVMSATKELTFYDSKMINIRYKCGESCTEPINCQNGGYRHPKYCSRCMCSDFHDGDRCEIERGLIELPTEGTRDLIYSKTDFDHEQTDERNRSKFDKDPLVVIKAPTNRRIRINIESIGSRGMKEPNTCGNFGVEIADGDLELTGKKCCAEKHTGRSFVSKSNVIGYRAYSYHGKPFESKISFSVEPDSLPIILDWVIYFCQQF
ncbi:hypothetical protein PENTCL1PPCAC_10534, partial [Pristionchus entomophagus]